MKRSGVLFVTALLLVGGMSSIAQAYQQYYDIAQSNQAQAEARQRNLPIAWLGSLPELLNGSDPQATATQAALATLQNQAVVIFFDGKNMAPVPAVVHAEFHQQDDGVLPNGANWTSPKVVFSDPEITKAIGRVSYTQMKGEGTEAAINSALQIIRNTPDALTPAKPVVAAVSNSAPPPPPVPYVDPPNHAVNYIVIIVGVCLASFIFFRGRARDSTNKP